MNLPGADALRIGETNAFVVLAWTTNGNRHYAIRQKPDKLIGSQIVFSQLVLRTGDDEATSAEIRGCVDDVVGRTRAEYERAMELVRADLRSAAPDPG